MDRRVILILAVGLQTFLPAGVSSASSSSRSGESVSAAVRESAEAMLPVFHFAGDSVSGYVDGSRWKFSAAAIPQSDSTRLRCAGPLILLSDIDTLVVFPRLEPVRLLLRSPRRTIRETVFFSYFDPRVELLKRYAAFSGKASDSLPSFRYAGPGDPTLAALRNEFGLDSIAGSGSDVQRILNLMEWAHTVVRHDGNSSNPNPRTAYHLIQVCRTEGRGVNCRMMATILNEALLAEGFKSRFVTCQPYDKTDPDCHVTDMAFCPSLDKWVYVDPTFGGYFTDENGVLLNHSEIRDRIRDGGSLRVPDTMDWNGKPYDPWKYVKYMAKNLFRFNCPVSSEPGYESEAAHPEWVALNPSGYDSLKAGTCDRDAKGTVYYTDNAERFWSRP